MKTFYPIAYTRAINAYKNDKRLKQSDLYRGGQYTALHNLHRQKYSVSEKQIQPILDLYPDFIDYIEKEQAAEEAAQREQENYKTKYEEM